LVSGKEYLEVKWRLVWLRSEHPDAIIDTELVAHQNNHAIFKAYVKLPGGGSATGYGSEDSQGFGDYLEKAETKAIGRALAALGYGTQFCGDFDYGAVGGRVVDAPTQFRAIGGPQDRGPNAPQPSYQQQQRPAPSGGNNDLASDRQMSAIYAIGKALGFSQDDAARFAQDTIGTSDTGTKSDPRITRAQATALIEALNTLKESAGAGVPI